MKKTISKIITLLLAFIIALGAVGCKKDDKKDNEPTTSAEFGTHVYNVDDSDKPFVVNGKTEYVLVMPAVKSSTMLNAQEEFAYFFKMATNISIGVASDADLPDGEHKAGTKYISLGDTSLFKSSGLTADKSVLGVEGFRIVTKDENIYIFGTTDYGVRYGVYQFMRMYFNFEQYTVNTIIIDKDVKNINLKLIDVTDVPDFDYRRSTNRSMDTFYTTVYDHKNFARRIGVNDHMHTEVMQACNVDTLKPVAVAETNMEMLPRNGATGSQHPKWFSDNGEQWCYTAHGDEAELELMIETVFTAVVASLKYYNPKDYPRAHILCVDIKDNNKGCSCEACSKMANDYGGANSAAVVKFLNRLAVKVREWFSDPANAEYYREDFKIRFLAYLHMTQSPTYYDEESGTYKPFDESVICDDMIMVDLANIDADWQQSVFSEDNKWVKDINEGWAAIAKNGRIYVYPSNLRCRMAFYDNFCFLSKDEIQYYASLFKDGESMMYYESASDSVFENLKCYVNAKQMWNTNLDENELIDNYFSAVYGNAAKYMKEYLNDLRLFYYTENERLELFCRNSVMNYVHLKFNWSEQTVYKWLEYGNKALEVISVIEESDPETYDRIAESIEIEMLSPIYFLLENCSNKLNATQKEELKARVRADVERWPYVASMGVMSRGPYLGTRPVSEWIEMI